MQENDFEKNVQQQMGDFNLSPSEEVWIEVEQRIRRDKRRRFFFWWPLAFLLLGGGVSTSIWMVTKSKKEESLSVKTNSKNLTQPIPESTNTNGAGTTIIQSKDVTIPKSKTTTNETEKKQANKKNIVQNKENSTNGATPLINSSTIEKEKNTSVDILNDGTSVSAKNNGTEFRIPEGGTTVTKINNRTEVPVKNNITNRADTILRTPGTETSVSAKINGTELNSTDQSDTSQKSTINELVQQASDTATKNDEVKQNDKKEKKWNWGIAFSGGRSSVSEGLNFFQKVANADVSQFQTQSTSPQSNTSSSLIRPSFSWSAGLFVKKPVSEKLDVNIGLNYQYLSTHINVGSRVDSNKNINNSRSRNVMVSNYYTNAGRSGVTNDYINRYHLVNLSAELSWRIVNSKKLKLYWTNGIGYSRLLSSTMLHYDGNLPGYYKDNSILTKNHLFFSTGFSIPVAERVSINPFASYSLTPVMKNADLPNSHFTNLGIRFIYSFKYKK